MGEKQATSNWPRAILHLDMDAFFVNVHLLEHPEDRGIPLVVGGRPNKRGVVASASYEARAFGIRSAMPSSRAQKLCPEVKFVGHSWPRIRETSRQVMDILRRYGEIEQVSVDEAYVDLSHHDDPESLALIMREQVRSETNCPASVGLSTSKLVAKVASDYDKPAGCTIVQPGQEAVFLAPLSVRAIWGIGPRTAEKLAGLHIYTCGDLASFDPLLLRQEFGKNAESLQRRAQGVDSRPVESESGPAKSISQERTFNEDVDDNDYLEQQLEMMSGIVAESLQKKQLVAHTVTVKFRLADFTTFTRQRSVPTGIDSAEEIFRQARAVWRAHWRGEQLRLLGVGVSNLEEPAGRQLELF